MFNAEKLLGGLLGNALGKSTSGSILGSKGAVGLGLLGVAMAAADHFLQNRQPAQPQPQQGTSGPPQGAYTPTYPAQQPPRPAMPGHMPPPPPPAAPGLSQVQPSAPGLPQAPPPPVSGAGLVPPPLDAAQRSAVLLIQAMIAAAHADGELDEDEARRILERFQSLDLSPEEQAFLERELQHPKDAASLGALVDSPELARQVYAASLLAVEVDTPEEEAHLRRLQELTGLSEADVADIRRELGLA